MQGGYDEKEAVSQPASTFHQSNISRPQSGYKRTPKPSRPQSAYLPQASNFSRPPSDSPLSIYASRPTSAYQSESKFWLQYFILNIISKNIKSNIVTRARRWFSTGNCISLALIPAATARPFYKSSSTISRFGYSFALMF